MRRTSTDERMSAWVVDYSEARARAITWLGDRYLLAKPVRRRHGAMQGKMTVTTAVRDRSAA
jgi:hypothetical protein